MSIQAARITAIVGPSARLRDEALAPLLAAWRGELKRVVEPDDLARILLDLDTPSLFSEPALWLVRADTAWVKRHAEALAQAAAQPMGAGALVLLAPELDRRSALAKALDKAGALHDAAGPDDKGAHAWAVGRLTAMPVEVTGAAEIATLLVDAFGPDPDALLGAMEQIALYAGDEAVSPTLARAVVAGVAERPPWEVVGALLDGDARRCLELISAGSGQAPELVLGAVAADLRRMLACAEERDDAAAAKLAAHRGSPYAMRHARRRLQAVGRASALRLLNGVAQTWRQTRQGGADPALVLEMFVLHARRVVRPGGA